MSDRAASEPQPSTNDAAAPLRCPRCGARLGERASAALRTQRAIEARGDVPAVPDDAAFCGCCGLLFASAG